MEKLDFTQLNEQALPSEQTECCIGGSGGGKIIVVDLEGL
jgi:hypothetical protein